MPDLLHLLEGRLGGWLLVLSMTRRSSWVFHFLGDFSPSKEESVRDGVIIDRMQMDFRNEDPQDLQRPLDPGRGPS